jgi:hypothetical protein
MVPLICMGNHSTRAHLENLCLHPLVDLEVWNGWGQPNEILLQGFSAEKIFEFMHCCRRVLEHSSMLRMQCTSNWVCFMFVSQFVDLKANLISAGSALIFYSEPWPTWPPQDLPLVGYILERFSIRGAFKCGAKPYLAPHFRIGPFPPLIRQCLHAVRHGKTGRFVAVGMYTV